MSSLISFLESWYHSNCDGEWEHEFGLKIDTLDNPGWSVEIDLECTDLENKDFLECKKNCEDNDDWILCKIEEKKFKGYGSSGNLEEILEKFKEFAES